MDYVALYDLEGYVCRTVRDRFRTDGRLSAFDFFCIIIWKASRAKSKIAARMLARPERFADLDSAVVALTSALATADRARARLQILHQWGFRLPMASAILSVLFPEEFTVYDVRVCGILGDFKGLEEISNFDRLWERYHAFVEAVRAAAPDGLTLRDKDRYLWAKSFADQLDEQLRTGFARAAPDIR